MSDRHQSASTERDDCRYLTGFRSSRVTDGIEPHQHGAFEQRQLLWRQIRIDLHQGTARDDRVACESRIAEVMMNGASGSDPPHKLARY